MADIDSAEPLAGAMLTQRESPLAVGLFDQAQGIFDRFEGFGLAEGAAADTLLDALIGRWSLPERLENGLELFDLDVLGELSHGWSARDGYFDTRFDFDGPFVVPVDPDVPAPIDGGHVRRSRRRRPPGAMRPAAPRTVQSTAVNIADRITDRWRVEPAAAEFGAAPLDAALVEPTETPSSLGAAAPSAEIPAPWTPAEAVSGAVDAPGRRSDTAPASAKTASELQSTLRPPAQSQPSATRAEPAPDAARGAEPARRDARMGPTERTTAPRIAAAGPTVNPPRPMSTLARQRWRASGERSLTPYPRAMGRAGAVDASLLRFPDARARLGGARPAILAGAPEVDLVADGRGLAPASRGAERLVQRLFDHLAPVAEPVSAWLMPWIEGDSPPMIGASPMLGAGLPALGGAASVSAGGPSAAAPRPSALADRAPSAELITPDAMRTPADAPPARSIAAGRRRPDGRLPLTARTMARPQPAATPASGQRALEVMSAARAGRTITEPTSAPATGPLSAPAATGPLSASMTTTGPMSAAMAAGPAAAGARAAATGSTRSIGLAAGLPIERMLPAATRAALAAEGRRPASLGGAAEPRPVPISGARAWLRDALESRAFVSGRSDRLIPAAADRGGLPRPEPRDRPSAAGAPHPLVPGATGAAARLMAERMAVAAGEPSLLARLPDRAPSPSVMVGSGVMGSVDFVSALAPEAAAVPVPADTPARRQAAEVESSADVSRPMEPSSVRPAATDDPGAEPVPRSSNAAVADAYVIDDAGPDAVAPSPPGPAETRAATPSDASAWAERIAHRLGVDRPDSPGLAAVVERITDRLVNGGTLLAETLDRFEAAAPADRSRAWRAVIDEAGLDPETAALVEPVADRIIAPAERAAEGPRPAIAAATPDRPQPAPAPSTTAARRDAPSTERSRRSTPVNLNRSAPDRADRADRAAGRRPATGPNDRRSGPATRPGIGAAPRLGAAPGTFERRMGLSSAARPVAPAEARRWVIDAVGRRWLVPIGASASASLGSTRASPPGLAGATGTIEDSLPPLTEVGASPTAEMAERIVSALLPDGRPTGALAASTARLLTRLAPAQADAWIASGFDPLTLPATERALVAGAAPVQAVSPQAPPRERASTAAAPFADIVRSRAKALARPGALGSAMARMAGRMAERPAMAARAPAPERAVVAPDAGGTRSGPSSAGDRVVGAQARGAAPSGPSQQSSTRSMSRLPSSMDPAALVAAGASAAESRMPARLRQWAAIGDAPAVGPVPGDFGPRAPAVVVSPDGGAESAASASSSGAVRGSGAVGSSASPGSRTVASALRAFDRARVANGSKAPAVGRMAPSPAEVGQLVAAAMLSGPPGGRLFGDRGPMAVAPPSPAGRVYIETGQRAAGDQPLRSTGESAGPGAETNDGARHRLANQTEGDLSPEEQERIADEVIARLRRELEFEGSRFGEDEWD